MFGFGKSKNRLEKVRVAILATDGVEQTELDAVVKKLRGAGAELFILSLRPGKIQAMQGLKRGAKISVDGAIDEVHPASFGALFIPGGTISAERLRQSLHVLEFVRSFDRNAKPVAAIGHGALVLASAGVVGGRTLAAWPGIKDDLVNAGGVCVDETVVRDGNLLTSGASRNIGKFSKQIVNHFATTSATNLVAA